MESKPVKYNWGIAWELPDGTIHREDGPAVVWNNGRKEWWQYGKLHRLDGPALIEDCGDVIWCINDRCITYEVHQWARKFNIDLDNLTDEDKQMIALYWSNYGK